jgi:hypothetical protein
MDIPSLLFSFLIMAYVLFKEYMNATYKAFLEWPPSMAFLPELLLYGILVYAVLWKIRDQQKKIERLMKEKHALLDENEMLRQKIKEFQKNK